MRRVWLGILTVVIVGTLSELLIPNNTWLGNFLDSTGLGVFLLVASGAFVARQDFLLPALGITGIVWIYTVYVAQKIASVVEPTSLLKVMSNNVGGLAIYLTAAVVGAFFGMWLSSKANNPDSGPDSSLVGSD